MGVAFLPLSFYNNPKTKDHGKLCIILGKENGNHSYQNKFNFIAGKQEDGQSIQGALIKEVKEELGLYITQELLQKCLVSIVKTKITYYFTCFVSGISEDKWVEMLYRRDRTEGLAGDYKEMTEIRYFPICELENNKEILSEFVISHIGLILNEATKLKFEQEVHYKEFVNATPENEKSIMLS